VSFHIFSTQMSLPEPVPRFLKWLKKTEGRDKLYRLVAYGSKIPIHLLKTNGGDKDLIDRLSKGAKSVGQTRKLMRMFRSLEFIQDLLKAVQVKDPISRVLTVLKSTSLAIWMLVDHYQWMGKAGYLKLENEKRLAQIHSKAWFYGLLAGLLNEAYKLHLSVNSEKRDSEKEFQTKKKLAKSGLDIIVPMQRLEWLNVSDGWVGFCGTLTSLMGIYDTF
jgi:peroxin-11B